MKKEIIKKRKEETTKEVALNSLIKDDNIKGRAIIIRTRKNSDEGYQIGKDGNVSNKGNADSDFVSITVIDSEPIGWTQLYALKDLILNLQEKGAGKVKRDEKELCSFNYSHFITSFSIR
jgi:hypothetical protein